MLLRPTAPQPLPASSNLRSSSGFARLSAVAVAAALVGASLLHHTEAAALALGRVAVLSPLGEPLRAEVDILEITPEEEADLRVSLAGPDAFLAAGMEVNSALSGVSITLRRRADGRAFLSVQGTRPVNEPFIDLILEANWPAGRMVRDYTLLFDPPNLRPEIPAPLVAQAAPVPAPAPVAAALPSSPAPAPAASAVAQPAPATPEPASSATDPSSASVPEGASNNRIVVKRGDTAGRIATANRAEGVSLDQMLVAMLRANPGAFIGGNVNRVKAGAVLDLPDADSAQAVAAPEARQIIAAQSRDFNEFRRRLAAQVPAAAVATADRQVSGRVQAEVQETKPTEPVQDKLTLSKGVTPGQTSAEDQIAQERQADEASTRVAELSRNIDELTKLGPAVAAGEPASNTAEPPAPVNTDQALPEPAPTADAPAALEAATPAAAEPVPAPVAVEPPPAAPAEPPPAAEVAQESSFVSRLTGNPLILPVAAGLLLLLGGLGLYQFRKRKKVSPADSSFLESRLQPDSFFGSSGGQRIDTAEATASGSSMVYSPSQLDAAGDVDPVAEADVYLAYGRDLQAEEILKEAMRSAPTRVAIHNKLLEIYAKRRDTKAFEVVAVEAYGLTQGEGPEWERACELGKELDPANPLYQPGGAPANRPEATGKVPGANGTLPFGTTTLLQPNTEPSPSGLPANANLDFELDLDISQPAPLQRDPLVSQLDDLSSTDALTSRPAQIEASASRPMNFDLDFPSEPMPLDPREPVKPAGRPSAKTFADSQASPDFDLDEGVSLDVGSRSGQANPASELLSFDLNGIELDLNPPQTKATTPAPNIADDDGEMLSTENPLETKLSLAEEFRAIGDLEGARSLAEEVLAEASGALKAKASAFLADLA